MPNTVVNLHPPGHPGADEHARLETERKQNLFAWADRVLADLGLADKVKQANTLDELRRITFDNADASAIDLAIREALHPAAGRRQDHFTGMNEGMLKRLLKTRFHELKKQREAELRSGQTSGGNQSSTYNWTDDLKLDKNSAVRPLLHNLILFLHFHPQWQRILGFDEFSFRVVIRQRPPWGDEAPDTPWNDHHETLTRRWFQCEDINAAQGDAGRAVQAAARDNRFHPVREYLATAEQKLRFKIDPWQATVERWIGRRKEVSVSQALEGALKIPAQEQTQRAENRVATILTNLGFTQHRPRRNGRRPRVYARENAPNQTRTARTTS